MTEERFNEIIHEIYFNRGGQGTDPANEILKYIKTLEQQAKNNVDLADVNKSLNIGRFSISKYTPIDNDPIVSETSMWMMTDKGEGTTIDVEKLFEWAM